MSKLEVIKEGVVTEIEYLYGIYSPTALNIDTFVFNENNNVVFKKISSEENSYTFLFQNTKNINLSSINYLVITDSNNIDKKIIGYVAFEEQINLIDYKYLQTVFFISNSYIYVNFFTTANLEYNNHTQNFLYEDWQSGAIQHKNFVINTVQTPTTIKKDYITASSNIERKKLENFYENRNKTKLSINNNNPTIDELNYMKVEDNYIASNNENSYSVGINCNNGYNLTYLISLYNEQENVPKIPVGMENLKKYVKNTFLGFSPTDGIMIYTLIPFKSGEDNNLVVIYSGVNNCNRTNINLIKGLSYQIQADFKRPIIAWYYNIMYIQNGVDGDFIKTLDMKYTTLFKEKAQDKPFSRVDLIECDFVKRDTLGTLWKIPESFDMFYSYFSYSYTNKNLRFKSIDDSNQALIVDNINSFDSNTFSLNDLANDAFPLPLIYQSDELKGELLEPLENLKAEYASNFLFLDKMMDVENINNIHVMDNCILRIENKFLYVYRTSIRNLKNVVQNNLNSFFDYIGRDVLEFEEGFYQSTSSGFLLFNKLGEYKLYNWNKDGYEIIDNLKGKAIRTYRGCSIEVKENSINFINLRGK